MHVVRSTSMNDEREYSVEDDFDTFETHSVEEYQYQRPLLSTFKLSI